ncbi:DUF2059 domain-containing protein [Oricola cellulosilytica]|nr:DUF2059 domain-containing protein [Oricola cellulosilytica]
MKDRIRRAAYAAAVVSAVMPGAAHAQEPSDAHIAAARNAISALGATDPFDDILPAAALGLKGRLIANNPDLEDQISDIVDSETLAMVSRRSALEEEAARIYASAFTEEDLKMIAEFYETEAGQKLLQNGPIVSREVNGAVSVWARGIERDLLQNVVAKMNEAGLRANVEGAAPGGSTAPLEGAPAQGATQN